MTDRLLVSLAADGQRAAMNPDVVVVGSFVQDLAFRCADFPRPGETVLGDLLMGPGGKGSNQAVAAARAGVRTRFIGAVGRDAFAEAAAAFHRAERIDSHLIAKPPHATATASVAVNSQGQNEIIVAIGASARITPRDVPLTLLRGAKVVVCQHEANPEINLHVFRAARKLGAITVLNPAPKRADFDWGVLRFVDVLVPNETEFVELVNQRGTSASTRSPFTLEPAALTVMQPAQLQQLCRSFAVPTVIVTLGDRGCFISLPDRGEHLPAHQVEVVDSTGAGDAFVGAFAAGLVKNRGDQVAATRFANAAAALSVTTPGTSRSMPRASAIKRLLGST